MDHTQKLATAPLQYVCIVSTFTYNILSFRARKLGLYATFREKYRNSKNRRNRKADTAHIVHQTGKTYVQRRTGNSLKKIATASTILLHSR